MVNQTVTVSWPSLGAAKVKWLWRRDKWHCQILGLLKSGGRKYLPLLLRFLQVMELFAFYIHYHSRFLGEMPIAMTYSSCRSSSSVTKWVALITLERFDPESPNLTHTSVRTHSSGIPDMTPLATSGQHLTWKKERSEVPPPMALGRISRERFNRGSPNFRALCPIKLPMCRQ